jgi:hypothetical protein
MFVNKGGVLEGIQIWLNLPKSHKMIAPNYQHVKKDDMPIIKSADSKTNLKIVSGNLADKSGLIQTQTPVNIFIIEMEAVGEYRIKVDEQHEALIYLINGDILINGDLTLKDDENQMAVFNRDGETISLSAIKKSKLLFLSGSPLNEPVVSWGPYVMNDQIEILEAMRDYQKGKMGFLEN